jgi:hypothetical protein
MASVAVYYEKGSRFTGKVQAPALWEDRHELGYSFQHCLALLFPMMLAADATSFHM